MKILNGGAPPHLIRAYLTKHHDTTTLDRIHRRFAVGAHAEFKCPLTELFIRDEDRFYDKKAEDVREYLDSKGYFDDFLVIEDDYDETNAVWYVGRFTEEEDEGPTVGGRVLWKMRTIVDDVPMHWV